MFDVTDGHLLTRLPGGHTSWVPEAFDNPAGMPVTGGVDGSLRIEINSVGAGDTDQEFVPSSGAGSTWAAVTDLMLTTSS